MVSQIQNDALTEKIIACCFKVHRELGPGFSEKIYQNALKICLRDANLKYSSEKSYNVIFNNQKIGNLKLDLLVESKVIVEIKAITGILPKVFESQVIAYLKVTKLNVGLLVNFGNSQCSIRRLMF